jgi:hypothetical protein
LRRSGVPGRQRDEAAGHGGVAGVAAADLAAAAQTARQPQQPADQRDQPPQHGHDRDEQGRQDRGGGVDLPPRPDDLDMPGMVGEKADGGDNDGDQQESEKTAHHRDAPSCATSSPSTWCKAVSAASR